MEKYFENKDENSKYSLKYLNQGSEYIVFVDISRKEVLKLNKKYLRSVILNENDFEEEYDNDIKFKREVYNNLEKIFSKSNILDEENHKIKFKYFKKDIKKMLKAIDVDMKLVGGIDFEKEIVVEKQENAFWLENKNKYKVKGFFSGLSKSGFCENKEIKNIDQAENYVDRYFILEMLEIYNNSQYPEKIRELVVGIIKYIKETGYILDIFGENNIFLYTENEESSFKIMDIVPPGGKIESQYRLKDNKNFNRFRANYRFFYTIKTFAKKIGLQENINLSDIKYFDGYDLEKVKKLGLEL